MPLNHTTGLGRFLRLSTLVVVACFAFAQTRPAAAVAVPVNELGNLTPTATHGVGNIANTRFSDGTVDADADVDSSADITFAFETTLLTSTPPQNRVLVEFGGSASGLSLVLRDIGTLSFQTRDAGPPTELGGNATAYVVPAELLNQPLTIVGSVHLDPTQSRLNLFINDVQVISAVGGQMGDWAGGNGGGFFVRNSDVLAPNLGGNNTWSGPSATEATADSTLRLYEGVFAVAVPEPASLALTCLGAAALVNRRRRAA